MILVRRNVRFDWVVLPGNDATTIEAQIAGLPADSWAPGFLKLQYHPMQEAEVCGCGARNDSCDLSMHDNEVHGEATAKSVRDAINNRWFEAKPGD